MHELIKLKEMLCKELEEYGSKGELNSGTLEVVDKLAHAVKNLCKIIEAYEDEEYSGRGGSYNMGGMGNNSYARGGRGGRRGGANQYGSYASGGYSRGGRADELVEAIRSTMNDLPAEAQHEASRLLQKLEQM